MQEAQSVLTAISNSCLPTAQTFFIQADLHIDTFYRATGSNGADPLQATPKKLNSGEVLNLVMLSSGEGPRAVASHSNSGEGRLLVTSKTGDLHHQDRYDALLLGQYTREREYPCHQGSMCKHILHLKISP